MGLFVTTTGTDVPIEELGITIFDPTVDYDLTGQFDSEDLKNADSLTTAITGGVLIWKKTAGGAAVAAAQEKLPKYEVAYGIYNYCGERVELIAVVSYDFREKPIGEPRVFVKRGLAEVRLLPPPAQEQSAEGGEEQG